MYAAVSYEVFVTCIFSEAVVLFNLSCYVMYDSVKTGLYGNHGRICLFLRSNLVEFMLNMLAPESRSDNDM
jgi:hypothetical protein